MKKKIIWLLITCLMVAALVLTSCAQTSPEEEDVVTEEEVEPIKIGGPKSLTGWAAADHAEWFEGMELAVAEINTAGGLLGRPVELVLFDIGTQEPEKIIAAAEQLIGLDKVDAMITLYAGWGPDLEYFGRYDVPYIHAGSIQTMTDAVAADPELRNVFMIDGYESEWAKPAAAQLLALPYDYPNKTYASIHADDIWSITYSSALGDWLTEEGWETVIDEQFTYGNREWGPILSKIRELNPGIINFEVVAVEEGVTFIQQFLENPTDSIIWTGYGGANPGYVDLLGEDINGVMCSLWSYPLDTEKGNHFRESYDKHFAKKLPILSAGGGYDAVNIWANAVEIAGDPSDYDAVCEALRTARYEGVLGWYYMPPPGQFAEYGDYADNLLPVTGGQYQDGKPTRLFTYTTPDADNEFQLPPWIK
ncbi:ABC transporter substrate-binding protein [Chloroflexota bacterium]